MRIVCTFHVNFQTLVHFMKVLSAVNVTAVLNKHNNKGIISSRYLQPKRFFFSFLKLIVEV